MRWNKQIPTLYSTLFSGTHQNVTVNVFFSFCFQNRILFLCNVQMQRTVRQNLSSAHVTNGHCYGKEEAKRLINKTMGRAKAAVFFSNGRSEFFALAIKRSTSHIFAAPLQLLHQINSEREWRQRHAISLRLPSRIG